MDELAWPCMRLRGHGEAYDDAAEGSSITQCALLLPLAFDLVPGEHRDRVLDNLVGDILDRHAGHSSVGLLGNQWLLPTLSRLGRPDVAFTIATRTDRPSWGYMIAKGATTIWERWDSDTRGPGMNSEALLIQVGSLGAWLVETLAGIAPDPDGAGFRRVHLRPCPVDGLPWAGAEIDTPYGRGGSHWRWEVERWLWEVVVPASTTAVAVLPVGMRAAVDVDGLPLAGHPAIRILPDVGGRFACEIAAGRYFIKVTP